MNLCLREITVKNWYKCTRIQITEEQRMIVDWQVVYWMAECRYRSDLHELAIYWDEEIVGFLVWALEPNNHEYWIAVIMIDQQFQNKGFGQMALKEVISLLSTKSGCQRIWIGHKPTNTIAAHIYAKMGFHDTGKREGEEIIRCLTLK